MIIYEKYMYRPNIQKSCAITKMSARCTVYMSALKVLNVHRKFEICIALTVPKIIAIGVFVESCEP